LVEKVKIHPGVIFKLNSEKNIFFSRGACTIDTKEQVAVFSAFPYMLEYWKS